MILDRVDRSTAWIGANGIVQMTPIHPGSTVQYYGTIKLFQFYRNNHAKIYTPNRLGPHTQALLSFVLRRCLFQFKKNEAGHD